jgi:hypothetical protein
MNLSELPEPIIASLLAEWLELTYLATLDTAYCNWAARPSYLAALKCKGALFRLTDDCMCSHEQAALMEWATKRDIKFKAFALIKPVDLDRTMSFLRYEAATLERLSLINVGLAVIQQFQQRLLHLARIKQLSLRICDGIEPAELSFLSEYSQTLEVLAFRDAVRMEQIKFPFPCPMVKLHTILLDNNVWLNGNHSEICYNVSADCHLFKRCPNLLRLFALTDNKNMPILHALAAHCPRLQQLHVAFSTTSGATAVAEALLAVLQGCADLRVLNITSGTYATKEQWTTIAAHCGQLTAFRIFRFRAENADALIPGLCSVQHLSLDDLYGDMWLLSEMCLPRHQLKSLTMRYKHGDFSTEQVVEMCQNLTCIEELRLAFRNPYWITDGVLAGIAAHCKCLRRLSLSCFYDDNIAYTTQGVTALLQGCSLHLHKDGTLSLPAEVRALRPDVTFRDEDFEACSFWQAPENSGEAY